jgi:hypothetical protein
MKRSPKPPADDRRYPKRPMVGVGALIFQRGRILLEYSLTHRKPA